MLRGAAQTGDTHHFEQKRCGRDCCQVAVDKPRVTGNGPSLLALRLRVEVVTVPSLIETGKKSMDEKRAATTSSRGHH